MNGRNKMSGFPAKGQSACKNGKTFRAMAMRHRSKPQQDPTPNMLGQQGQKRQGWQVSKQVEGQPWWHWGQCTVHGH